MISLKIEPIKITGIVNGITHYEVCSEKEAQLYSLYYKNNDGLSVHIADFETKAEAKILINNLWNDFQNTNITIVN